MPYIHQETNVTSLRVRRGSLSSETQKAAQPQAAWQNPEPKHPGEGWLRNLGVAAALVLCAVTLRSGALPALNDTTDVILAAATDNSLLDDQLGKLSFVSTLFPEAVLVFGETKDETLCCPVNGGVVIHAWSEAEPYMTWRSSVDEVVSVSGGEVIGVYHGNGDERLVQVLGEDGLSFVYGNLAEVTVQAGDAVASGSLLGRLIPGEDCAFEVRRHGVSIDPAQYSYSR